MSTAADLQLMGASALLDSDPAGAARRAGEILADAPEHAGAQLLLATACRRIGDPARSVAVLEALSAAQPKSAHLHLEKGRAYAAAGRSAEAAASIRAALALDPALLDAWRELAAQLFAMGDDAEGDLAYANYERRAADPPGLQDALAALAEERFETAESLLKQVLRGTPDDATPLRLLAEVASRRENFELAEELLNACLRLAPGYARARYDLANVYFMLQRPQEVLALLDRLLAVQPDHAPCLDLKARTLRLVGRFDEAVALTDAAVSARPTDGNAWVLRGHVLREVGRSAEAIDAYRRAIAVQPDSSEAFFSLANMKTARFAGEEIEAVRQLLSRTTLLRDNRVRLEFALGKALEDAAEYADSFAAYARGNALHRAKLQYDPNVTTSLARRSKALYTPEFFRDRQGWGSERADPIFIVGVPRSGSTLIEQILATHSQVEGTRELSELSIVAGKLVAPVEGRARANYPDAIARLDRAAVEAAAAEYLQRTSLHRTLGRPRFIDKMPANFSHLGLIHLLYPNCAIIDARRQPMGTGFSCFAQLFAFAAAFSYDQAELGRYIRDYADMMDDFDRVLPGRVHRVYYERLIANPEAEVRALLEHCRLPYEEGCLRFHENRRVVQSISSEQVRQPLYAEGLDHWKHFEPWLGPLRTALGELVERYPVASASAVR